MKILRVIVDNSTTFVGLLGLAFGMAATFGIDLTSEQVGAVTAFAGGLITAIGLFVTVAKRQVVTTVDAAGVIRAGPAATQQTGTPADVVVDGGALVSQVAVKPELLKAA